MTKEEFNRSVILEIRAMMNRETSYKAMQVCNAGDWPETDHGGNWTPDRVEANMAFSEWLDQQGDSLPLPKSYSDWLQQGDAIEWREGNGIRGILF